MKFSIWIKNRKYMKMTKLNIFIENVNYMRKTDLTIEFLIYHEIHMLNQSKINC